MATNFFTSLLIFSFFMQISVSDFPFRDVTLPWKDRVDDLVSRLTMEEVMQQMARGGGGVQGGPAPAIERLGIGPYQWTTECLRGDVGAGNATGFPQAIGLAATFSDKVLFKVAEATGVEVRAKFYEYQRQKDYADHTGLSCFSPVINIMRHPLWGRNQETYGEDPYLSGVYVTNFVKGLQGDHPRYVRANAGCKHFDAFGGPQIVGFNVEETYGEDPYLSGVYATNFVKGLQGDHPRYVRANAGCKHFDVHGGPENIPSSRFNFKAEVSERDWRLTFLPAFKKCVEAGTYSLMCSFNSINGVPACANSKLMTTILRQEWGFKGYVISDMGAIENVMNSHHYYLTPTETAAGCMTAGCNLELSPRLSKDIYSYILQAVNESKVTEEAVRENIKPLFYTRMRLGEFDPPSMNPYTQLNMSDVLSVAHRKLAAEAAIKSVVMLKNTGSLLPLTKGINKVAVVGPMADNAPDQFGDYTPNPPSMYITTPIDALFSLANIGVVAPGCTDGNVCKDYNSSQIQNAVMDADVTFVCLGTGIHIEYEGRDRSSMELPGKQQQLLQDVISYGQGKPIVLLLFSAGPVNITMFEDHPLIVNIFQMFFPAQATGEAVMAVVTADGVNPAGRLPYTWYRTADQIPSMTEYNMKERTYRYFTGDPLYPFGYGLSYTTFNYSNLIVAPTVKAGDNVSVQVMVTNLGVYDGDEVVQVYIQWLTTREAMPKLQLVSFDRVFVPKKTTIDVILNIEPSSLAVWTVHGFVIEEGAFRVYVGGQQPNQKRQVSSNVLSTQFKIAGSKHIM